MIVKVQIDEDGHSFSVYYPGGTKYGSFPMSIFNSKDSFWQLFRRNPDWIKTSRFESFVTELYGLYLADQVLDVYSDKQYEYDTEAGPKVKFRSSDPLDFGPN